MDKSNGKITELIQKSLHAGSVYKLTLKDKPTEHDLRHWFANFLSLFEVDQQCIITKFPYLWRDGGLSNDDNDPIFGYPASIDQLVYIYDDGRLDKLKVSEDEVNLLRKTILFCEKETDPGACTVTACGKKCGAVCDNVRAVANKMMVYITGGMHKDAYKAFSSAATIRQTIQKFYITFSKFLLGHLGPEFDAGGFANWSDLKNTIRRAFGIMEKKETMADLFRRIDEISTSSMNTEGKMFALKEIVRQIAITKKDDYIEQVDREEQPAAKMKAPEFYGPLVNTLLSFIIVKEKVPKANWDAVQVAFEQKIQSGWSYANWHANCPELYKILDQSKPGSSSRTVGSIETEDRTEGGDDSEDDRILYAGRDNRKFKSPRRSYNQKPGEKKFQSKPEKKEVVKSKATLCIHCSYHHPNGLAVYHPPGARFNGKGEYCLYDSTGREKMDARGRSINQIDFEKYDEGDGIHPIMADVELFQTETAVQPSSVWRET